MPEPALTPRTGLEHAIVAGRYGAGTDTPGVVITLRNDVALASIMVRAGKLAELSNRVNEIFGTPLPATPRRVDNGAFSVVWAGPGQWLAAMENTAGHVFTDRLCRDLDGLASIVNQSDGRNIIRISGPMVRHALAKGVPIDLHPGSFGPGDTALTAAGHINVQFWQLNATPSFEFVVFRSLAAAFCKWLLEISAEYGVSVTDEH